MKSIFRLFFGLVVSLALFLFVKTPTVYACNCSGTFVGGTNSCGNPISYGYCDQDFLVTNSGCACVCESLGGCGGSVCTSSPPGAATLISPGNPYGSSSYQQVAKWAYMNNSGTFQFTHDGDWNSCVGWPYGYTFDIYLFVGCSPYDNQTSPACTTAAFAKYDISAVNNFIYPGELTSTTGQIVGDDPDRVNIVPGTWYKWTVTPETSDGGTRYQSDPIEYNFFLGGGRDATCVSNTIPTIMYPGQTVSSQVVMHNNGNTNWSSITKLGRKPLSTACVSGVCPDGNIACGKSISAYSTAPELTDGNYATSWSGGAAPKWVNAAYFSTLQNFRYIRLLPSYWTGTTNTGPMTAEVYINGNLSWVGTKIGTWTGTATDNQWITIDLGQTYQSPFVNINVLSTSSTWVAWREIEIYTDATMACEPSLNFIPSTPHVSAPSYPVTAGSDATFSFNLTAPTTVGNYSSQWKMLEEGNYNPSYFGELCGPASISVQIPTCTVAVSTDNPVISIGQTAIINADVATVPFGVNVASILWTMTSGTVGTIPSNTGQGVTTNTFTGVSPGTTTINVIVTPSNGGTTCTGSTSVTVSAANWWQVSGGDVYLNSVSSQIPAAIAQSCQGYININR